MCNFKFVFCVYLKYNLARFDQINKFIWWGTPKNKIKIYIIIKFYKLMTAPNCY